MGQTIVYGVSWIEIEFGERDEGHRLFMDKQQCILETKKSSQNGHFENCPGEYLGPERPLCYTEIPFTSLEEEYRLELAKKGICHTDNYWQPKFSGETTYISPT